jgi:hypothetical protein
LLTSFGWLALKLFNSVLSGLALSVLAGMAMAQDCAEPMSFEKSVVCEAKKNSDLKKCNQLDSSDKVHHCRAVAGINSFPCDKIASLGVKMQCLRTVQVLQRQGG